MRTSRVKLLLWSATALTGAAAVLAVVAALMLPLDLPAPASHAPTVAAAAPSDRTAAAVPLDSFKPLWDLQLRRPLVDPPPPAVPVITPAQVAAARAASVRPPVRLAGTVRDGATGRPRGLFVTAGGRVELRGAGERVAGAEVIRVDDKGATLSAAGQTYQLKLERFEPPATRPSTGAAAHSSPRPAGGV